MFCQFPVHSQVNLLYINIYPLFFIFFSHVGHCRVFRVPLLYVRSLLQACSVAKSCLTLCDPMECSPPGPLSTGFPRQEYGVGCHSLLQGVFPIQASNPGLLHCRLILYHRATREAHPDTHILLYIKQITNNDLGCPGGSGIKNLPANAGDPGLIPGLGRSPGGRHGNPLQYSCLEKSMDKGAQQAKVHRVAQSPTQLKRLSSSSMQESIPIFNLFSPIIPQEP